MVYDEYMDVLLPRQSRQGGMPPMPTSTSSEYHIVSTYTSVNIFGQMATFSVTVPPAALTTYTVANTYGLGVVVTSELPQESLTTYTITNSFNLGVVVTTRRDPEATSSTPTASASATPDASTTDASSMAPTASPAGASAPQSTATSSPPSSDGHGLSGGAIAAAVVVPIVVVALLIAAGFLLLRRRRKRRSAARVISFNGTGAAVVGGSRPPPPPMAQANSSGVLTALPRMDNGAETPASTKTGDPFNDPSISSASGHVGSSIRSASGGRHVAASRRPNAEPIAELPADSVQRDADGDDAASIDSDFSFHHAEVADASQARKQRASVVQLSGSPPKEHGSPKETGSPK